MIHNPTASEIQEILAQHAKWLRGESDGRRANLYGANLSSADLSGANLSSANLRGAYLSSAYLYGANLRGANLYGAYLSSAYLYGANLRGANLSSANLSRADLRGADLRDANLYSADLSGANLSGAKNVPADELSRRQIVPEVGSFTGFKKAYLKDDRAVVLQLEIPADAARLGGLTGRKCRAERAKVVAVFSCARIRLPAKKAYSGHDPDFAYLIGDTAIPDKWDGDALRECAAGIHFFLTFQEAAKY